MVEKKEMNVSLQLDSNIIKEIELSAERRKTTPSKIIEEILRYFHQK